MRYAYQLEVPMELLTALILLVGLFLSHKEISAAELTRPNILFVFCDDLTCQALSTYGEKRRLLQTPKIDRMAGKAFGLIAAW